MARSQLPGRFIPRNYTRLVQSFPRGSSPPPSVQLSMARPVQLSMAVDTHAVFNTDGLARGLCNPLEPPASRAAGRRSRTRPRCARGGAAVTPPPLPARCGRAMPLGWGTWCRSQAASDPRVAASRREPCDSPWTSAGARTCRGSRGRSPSSAPAGDPRSVAPKGRLAHDC